MLETGSAAAIESRRSRLEIAAGCLAIVLGLLATTLDRSVAFANIFLSDRARECREHSDGDPEYVHKMLERERLRLRDNLVVGLLGFGAGCLAVGIWRSRGRRFPAFCGPLTGALVVAAIEFGTQLRLLGAGASAGLFTETREAHAIRFFDAAVEPARIIVETVPADARIVVVNFDDPQVLKKVQYLIFPRRVFMPPRAEMQFDVGQIRQILERMPHGIDWCFEAGYTHILDLTTLRHSRDPSAILELESLRR